MSTVPDLRTRIGEISLRNPIVLASGVMGTSPSLLIRAANLGMGAVTAKSCGPVERTGHPNPVMVAWEHGLLNAIGLTNPGVAEEVLFLGAAKQKLKAMGVPLFASIFAGTYEEYNHVAASISTVEPDLIEVNISCPNVHDEYGLPFAADPVSAAAVTREVKRVVGDIPISVKLAPNVPDVGRIAQSVVDAGADVITAINTMPGLVINAAAAQPVLSNQTGGISGPALKPIALRCVAEIARSVKVPIIGTGGVLTGIDAVEMLMAGATAVGVGSAFWYRGEQAIAYILDEIQTFMQNHQYSSINKIIGKAIH